MKFPVVIDLPHKYVRRMEEVKGSATIQEFFEYCIETQLSLMNDKNVELFEEVAEAKF